MDIRIDNQQALLPERDIKAMVDFLAPLYGEVAMPVRVSFVRARGDRGSSGIAYFPRGSRGERVNPVGTYNVRIYVRAAMMDPWRYPFTWTYREGAGPCTSQSYFESCLHTLAHELRHIEQFDACDRQHPRTRFRAYELATYPNGSCEVDAERVAHRILDGWRTVRDNRRRRRKGSP